MFVVIVRVFLVIVRIFGIVFVMVVIIRVCVLMLMVWVVMGVGMRKIVRNGDSVGIFDGMVVMMRVRWWSRSLMLVMRLMFKLEVGIFGFFLLMERIVIFLNF